MWVVVTAEGCGPPGVHFEYHPGRQHRIARDMVGDLECVLVTDGYGAYDEVGDGIDNSRCMTHIRRPFANTVKGLGGLEAAHARGSASADAVDIIRELYDLERKFKGLSPEDRARARCERSWPVMLRLVGWAATTQPDALPGTQLANGIAYLIDNVNRMGPWLCDGLVPIDNNRAERAIRPFTVGRRGWLFCDTVAGAEASAGMYSIVQTAMMNGLHTGRYLEWVLAEMPKARPTTPEGYARFLPWSKEVPESCLVVPGETVGDPTAPPMDPDDDGQDDPFVL